MSTENAIIIILLMGILCIGILVLMRLTTKEKEVAVEGGWLPGAFGLPPYPYYSHIPVRYIAY